MTQHPSAVDWQGTRGHRWLAQLAGMEAMLRPVDDALIDALALDVPLRIAEIGCGGGATTLELVRRAPAGSTVHGFDISERLVEHARLRAAEVAPAPTFALADVSQVTPQQPFQRLVSRFGVMFFDHPRAAFRNLFGWLSPGGRFTFAVWAAPVDNDWFRATREVVARFVTIPPADADAPGPFRYGVADKLVGLLGDVGFARLAVRDWRGPMTLGASPEAAAHFALAAFSNFGELLERAGPTTHAEAHDALAAQYAQHVSDGAVRMAARVHIVTGAHP